MDNQLCINLLEKQEQSVAGLIFKDVAHEGREPGMISHEFSQPLMDHWNGILAQSGHIHDLGQTPEWCRNWAETYRKAYDRLVIISDEQSVFPLMIRRIAGLRVMMWLGQSYGMESDYSGGAGSYKNLFNCLRELDGWDVACLQLPFWQSETREVVKAVRLYEKYMWTVETVRPTVITDLPGTFEEWLMMLSRETRKSVRRNLKCFEQSDASFEILRGDVASGLDDLIANNEKNWTVLRAPDIAFMKKTAGELSHNTNFFLARLYAGASTWATALGYWSGTRVSFHMAGVHRERFQGMSPGTTMDALMLQEFIKEGVRQVDYSPGLEPYKFSLGGHWEPNHHLVFARNRLFFCWYRMVCATSAVYRSICLLARRKIGIPLLATEAGGGRISIFAPRK